MFFTMEKHQINTTKAPVEVIGSMNMQPDEQMQLWLLSLLFYQAATTENTHSLTAFRWSHTDAHPARDIILLKIHK